MRADIIASKGRISNASAVTVGSFGRIITIIEKIVVVVKREIFEAYSRITKYINLNSKIGD